MISKDELLEILLKLTGKERKMTKIAADESMRVASITLNRQIQSIEDKKEILDIVKTQLKVMAEEIISQGKRLRPMAFLLSPSKAYLCEMQEIAQDANKRYSLLGHYAKKFKCYGGAFISASETVFRISHDDNILRETLFVVSIAYDETLLFERGEDIKTEVYLIAKEGNEVVLSPIPPYSNIELEKDALNGIRKPIADIISLGKTYFN